MSQHKYLLSLTFAILLIALGLSGCGQAELVSAASEAEAPLEAQVAAAPAEDDLGGAAVPDGLAEDEGEALPEEAEPDYCLQCHSDQETLMAVADPEEETESESEGEG